MTKDNYIYGFHSINAYLSQDANNIETIYLEHNRKDKRIAKLITQAKKYQLPIRHCSLIELNQLCINASHQGVIAKVTNIIHQIYPFEEFLRKIQNNPTATVLILDGITDPHNLGAIIRTANGFGINGIILPQNNSANINNPIVVKTSSGAIHDIPIIIVNNLTRTISQLKEYDFWVFGTSLNSTAISLTDFKHQAKTVWVMGNEGNGLRRLVAESCDYLVTIPMHGKIQSLNVSVATGIVLYHTKLLQNLVVHDQKL